MAAAKLFDPKLDKPYPLSRSKVELFFDCPRCFYLDQRLGVGRPAGFPFNLNAAVDALLKREFDEYRAQGKTHPLMATAGINAVPHAHPELETSTSRACARCTAAPTWSSSARSTISGATCPNSAGASNSR